tara:strand:- start:1375 stop:2535 length:1161 start_codon:yes stop_codon:yes gene_type:complete
MSNPKKIKDIANKPYQFPKGEITTFTKKDVHCKNLQKVDDPVYHYKSNECYLRKPPTINQELLPSFCRSNFDCPRGYICQRNECFRHHDVDHIEIPEAQMWCNVNGWVPCWSGNPISYCTSDTQSECNDEVDYYGFGCIWCSVQNECRSQAYVNLLENQESECGIPGDSWQGNTLGRELGCTDPYAVNYNPNAYAQRDEWGQGCPSGEDCCIYEGTKLSFSSYNSTEISLEPGSYIITFVNNEFANGGLFGQSTFWEAFGSLSPLKHAPQSLGGDFYIVNNDGIDAEISNQIKNSMVGPNAAIMCDPADPIDYINCSNSSWYHLTVYSALNYITNFKYRIFKCGCNINLSAECEVDDNTPPPPPPPPPGPNPNELKPRVQQAGSPK